MEWIVQLIAYIGCFTAFIMMLIISACVAYDLDHRQTSNCLLTDGKCIHSNDGMDCNRCYITSAEKCDTRKEEDDD